VTQELARTVYCGKALTAAELDGYHIMHRRVADFFLTESVFPGGFHLPKHIHNYHCIYLVLDGRFSETYQHKEKIRERLDVVLTPIGQPHADKFHQPGGRCFFIEIPTAWVERVRTHCSVFDSGTEFHSKALTWLMMKLYRESLNLDPVSPLVIEAGLLEIIATISRFRVQEPTRRPPAWLTNAHDLLRAHYRDPLTLGQVAESVGVHPVYLANVFRTHYGSSVGEFVRRLRIDYVSRQIASTDEPITNIAVHAGFADHSHLTKTFKKLTGLTPLQYRSLARRS
jgi:AraC family transcriptional regulator